MANQFETFRDAHRLIAKIVEDADMDDFEASDEVIDVVYTLCERHTEEADDLNASVESIKRVHSDLTTPKGV